MGEFFHGWRRKIGVLTLLLACVFTVGWVRSMCVSEVASSLISDQTQLFIHSTDGIFWCGRFFAHDPGYFSSQPTIRWVQYEDNKYNRAGWESISWCWRCSDVGIFGHSSGANPNGQRYDYLYFAIMPYWSIVIPLTLLSAWLLLSKPPKPKQKPVEPTATTGA